MNIRCPKCAVQLTIADEPGRYRCPACSCRFQMNDPLKPAPPRPHKTMLSKNELFARGVTWTNKTQLILGPKDGGECSRCHEPSPGGTTDCGNCFTCRICKAAVKGSHPPWHLQFCQDCLDKADRLAPPEEVAGDVPRQVAPAPLPALPTPKEQTPAQLPVVRRRSYDTCARCGHDSSGSYYCWKCRQCEDCKKWDLPSNMHGWICWPCHRLRFPPPAPPEPPPLLGLVVCSECKLVFPAHLPMCPTHRCRMKLEREESDRAVRLAREARWWMQSEEQHRRDGRSDQEIELYRRQHAEGFRQREMPHATHVPLRVPLRRGGTPPAAGGPLSVSAAQVSELVEAGNYAAVGYLILHVCSHPSTEAHPGPAALLLAREADGIVARKFGVLKGTYPLAYKDFHVAAEHRDVWTFGDFPHLIVQAFVLGAHRTSLPHPLDSLAKYFQVTAEEQERWIKSRGVVAPPPEADDRDEQSEIERILAAKGLDDASKVRAIRAHASQRRADEAPHGGVQQEPETPEDL